MCTLSKHVQLPENVVHGEQSVELRASCVTVGKTHFSNNIVGNVFSLMLAPCEDGGFGNNRGTGCTTAGGYYSP